MDEKYIIKYISKIILILLSAIILGVFIPGFISYYSGCFSAQDVFNNLSPNNQKTYLVNRGRQLVLEKKKQDIIDRFTDSNQKSRVQPVENVTQSLNNINNIENIVSAKTISLAPYYPNNTLLLLWPFLYFGLGILVFMIKPKYGYTINKGSFCILFILLTVLARWPTWVRNTSLGNIGRLVYSVSNFDVSKIGFFLQETQAIISILLLTYVICKWISYSHNLKLNLDNKISSEFQFIENTQTFRAIIQEWQIASVLLAVAFGYYTYYFWDTIDRYHDYRFIPHAIIIHIIWGFSWYVISMPLIVMNNAQIKCKEDILKKKLLAVA